MSVTLQDRRCVSHLATQATSAFARAILCLTLFAGVAAPSWAQKTTATATGRKVLVSVKPEYPETLRYAQIGGLVRLAATVQPNGTVSDVQIRGGNPILAEKARDAVMKWKYAPASTQTVEEVSLSFSPH